MAKSVCDRRTNRVCVLENEEMPRAPFDTELKSDETRGKQRAVVKVNASCARSRQRVINVRGREGRRKRRNRRRRR